jgi:phospholipid transport system substrate-binding protein
MNLRQVLVNGSLALMLIFLLAISKVSLADESQAIMAQITDNTKLLISRLQGERETYYTDPEKFYKAMDGALTDVVDFRRIAARVMGRYRRDASDLQKDQFVETFKKSLFNAYGKTLVESGDFDMKVQTAEIDPRKSDKASVNLEISTASGNNYPVIYNMYKNEKSQKWLLENVIVNGVNIGLAFRDRFQQQYEEHKGDLDEVIGQWSAQLPQDKNS